MDDQHPSLLSLRAAHWRRRWSMCMQGGATFALLQKSIHRAAVCHIAVSVVRAWVACKGGRGGRGEDVCQTRSDAWNARGVSCSVLCRERNDSAIAWPTNPLPPRITTQTPTVGSLVSSSVSVSSTFFFFVVLPLPVALLRCLGIATNVCLTVA
jgi:hypothetical protein